MRVVELQEEFPWTVDEDRTMDRVHVSDVVRDLLETLYGARDGVEDVEKKGHWEKGYLWETVLSQGLKERLGVRPGEVELDGILLSPDGVNWDEDGELVVEEYKCTTMSSNKTPDRVTSWMMQTMAYCQAVGANTVVFRILYLMGDYGEHRYPQYKVYRVEFTDGELEENWRMILQHAQMRGWV